MDDELEAAQKLTADDLLRRMRDGEPVDVIANRTYTWQEALSDWWSTDPVLAVDEALHRLPWRLHALLFSWWLCDLVDLRLGMTWKQVRQHKRIPSWRGALRHWR